MDQFGCCYVQSVFISVYYSSIVGSRSFIDQINSSSAVYKSCIVGMVSNLNCHIACSIIRNTDDYGSVS